LEFGHLQELFAKIEEGHFYWEEHQEKKMSWLINCYECMGECCYFGEAICSPFSFFILLELVLAFILSIFLTLFLVRLIKGRKK
jgi:hypothetical protein